LIKAGQTKTAAYPEQLGPAGRHLQAPSIPERELPPVQPGRGRDHFGSAL